MSLQIYIDNKALFEYFGWPEGMRQDEWPHNEDGCSFNACQENFYHSGSFLIYLLPQPINYLAIFQHHSRKIIGDRYDYLFRQDTSPRGKRWFLIDLQEKETGNAVFDWAAPDEDELLIETLQWILEQEKKDG